jgi:hypothetical protein
VGEELNQMDGPDAEVRKLAVHRQGITDDVLRGWRQGDFGRRGPQSNDDYSPINFEPKKRTWH